MDDSVSVLRGVIHGRTIELTETPRLPDGQKVSVALTPIRDDSAADVGAREALIRAAGAWSDDPEGLDQYLAWNRQQRKANRNLPE